MTLRKHALLEIVMTIIAIAVIWWWFKIPAAM
jgi:cbb3-type cytochrome oxidase subunit 3